MFNYTKPAAEVFNKVATFVKRPEVQEGDVQAPGFEGYSAERQCIFWRSGAQEDSTRRQTRLRQDEIRVCSFNKSDTRMRENNRRSLYAWGLHVCAFHNFRKA